MIGNDLILEILLYGGILFIFSEQSAGARARAHRTCALHPQHNQSLLALIVARRTGGYKIKHNVALIASRGPKRNISYDPHYAYESYWPAGEWVYKPYKPEKNVCGNYKCGTLYKMYGTICAKNNKNDEKAFANYCEMMASDCNGTEGWTLLNKGQCTDHLKTYQIDYTEVMGNVPKYLDEYKQRINITKVKLNEETAMKQAIENLKNKRIQKMRPKKPPVRRRRGGAGRGGAALD